MEKEKWEFIINEQMIKDATAYIPLLSKVAIATTIAQYCIQPVEMSIQKMQSDETLTLPQMYEDDTTSKNLHLMYILLTEYLHVQVNDDFSTDDYDKYAKFHPMNQLERFKSGSPEIKNKVFDLLYDFKELKKLIDTEIYNLKCARNDTLERFLAGVTLLSNPENVQKMVAELQKITEQVQEKQGEVKQKRATAKKTETVEKK